MIYDLRFTIHQIRVLRVLVLTLCIVNCASYIAKAQETPVMLFLSDHEQDDSLGFNIVQALPPLVYDQVMSGKVLLWDSPKKEEQIKPKSLQQIEKYSEVSLKECNQLFIYETWVRNKRSIAVKPFGMYFSTRKPDGEEVAFGFLDYSAIESILGTSFIPVNANGDCSLTFGDVLKQKLYYYNIVQYGDHPISKPEESVNIKNEIKPFLVSDKGKNPMCKTVNYSIESSEKSADPKLQKSRDFLNAIEKYFSDNPEFYLNLGGDMPVQRTSSYQTHVTKVEVEEQWTRAASGIAYSVIGLTVFSNNRALDFISTEEYNRWDLLVNGKPVNDYLKSKEFYFRILKINEQEISAEKSDDYFKALTEYRWNQVNEFVKYQ